MLLFVIRVIGGELEDKRRLQVVISSDFQVFSGDTGRCDIAEHIEIVIVLVMNSKHSHPPKIEYDTKKQKECLYMSFLYVFYLIILYLVRYV